MEMLRMTTLSVVRLVVMFTIMPVVPALRILARVPSPLRVMDLLMVTVPKPPGSSALISPLVAVLTKAPAKVWQGAVRLHGLASAPVPDTQVRVACACAAVEKPAARVAAARRRTILELIICRVLFCGLGFTEWGVF